MPYPESGGDTRIRITSTGSFVNPQVGDIWTIKLGRNIAASDFTMTQTRNGTPTSLTLVGMQHTVDANDKPAIGGSWPLTATANNLSLTSTPINVTNPATVPAAPTMGTATAGDNSASVPWTSGSNGGSAVTSRDIQIYDGSGNLIGTITGVANPAVLTSAQGILNGNSYKFKARENNAVGSGPYAVAFSNTVTPAVSVLLPIDFRTIGVGDSQMFASTVPTPVLPFTILIGGKSYLPTSWNQGVAGNTSQDVLNRMGPILAAAADMVLINIGTNDCGLTSDDANTINARVDNIIAQLFSAGTKYIILHTVLPRFGAAALSGPREAVRLAINVYRKALTDPRIIVVGQDSDWSAGDFDSGGLHQNYAGSWKFGADFANGAIPKIDPAAALPAITDPTNMLAATRNPQLAGTGGTLSGTPTPTGTAPNTWSVATTGTGIVVAASAVAGFHNGQIGERLQISGTPDANSRSISLSNSVSTTTAIGEAYEAWAYFELAAGCANMISIQGSVATLGATPGNTIASIMDAAPRSGIIRVPGYKLTTAPGSIGCTFGMRAATGVIGGDITISEPFLRKVTGANAANP